LNSSCETNGERFQSFNQVESETNKGEDLMPKSSNRSRSSREFGGGVRDMARERPIAAAAAAAAAVGAGVFLWSRRNQISDQLSELSDQISEWSQNFTAGDDTGGYLESGEAEGSPGGMTTGGTGRTTGSSTGRTGTTRGMSETGGGNASLGRRSGGSGIKTNASSRGRARGIPSTT
jgi:hypothetical protein